MNDRIQLLESISSTISDYRAGEIPTPDSDHVEKWIRQFDAAVQEPLLREIDHVLKQTYITKKKVKKFFSFLVNENELTGTDPCSFWEGIKFLKIQQGGNSQNELLAMFEKVLQTKCGLKITDCGDDPEAFLYLDDAIFTGNRILNDFRNWINEDFPKSAKVYVVTLVSHLQGQGYAGKNIQNSVEAAGKEIDISWWKQRMIENRRVNINSSDVLRPTSLPKEKLVQDYVKSLSYVPDLRKPGSLGEKQFFSSEDGRHLLEQELLKKGVFIRSICPNLNAYQRPLGNIVLQTLGFGALTVTFRNCPNNCPLAFWAGDPWYPLFPRKTN